MFEIQVGEGTTPKLWHGGEVLDLHTHVWPHEPGTPIPSLDMLRSYCDAAAAKGIEQLAITEHCSRFDRIAEMVLPHWVRPQTGELAAATTHVLAQEGRADLDAYVEALLGAQDAGLPILIGLEVDYLPGTVEAMSQVLADYPFDILLGSVHWLDDWLFDAYGTPAFAAEWDRRNTDDVFAHYVDSILELATSGLVDVLAHIDVIKVAGHRPARLAEHEARLVDGLAGTDVVIEFSSAGFRKPVAATYPSSNLLDQLLAAGFELTTASDAHTVEQIGWEFEQLTTELDKRGIDTLTTFSRRQRAPYQR